MTTYQSTPTQAQTPARPLKDSIRDMVQLQRNYQVSDELFWKIFDARVLLDQRIDVHALLANTTAIHPIVH